MPPARPGKTRTTSLPSILRREIGALSPDVDAWSPRRDDYPNSSRFVDRNTILCAVQSPTCADRSVHNLAMRTQVLAGAGVCAWTALIASDSLAPGTGSAVARTGSEEPTCVLRLLS
jgi:hypothetical protein